MKLRIYLAATLALIGAAASAQTDTPAAPNPGAVQQTPSLGTAAKDALNNVKSARSNIRIKDYPAAQVNISKAQSDLSAVQSNPEVNQLEGMLKSKGGTSSPLSKAQKQLGDANGALSENQPKAADHSLKKAEGLLASLL